MEMKLNMCYEGIFLGLEVVGDGSKTREEIKNQLLINKNSK